MDRRRKHERKRAAEGAEIGSLPEVADWSRRRACGQSLQLFLETYFPESSGKNLLSAAHVRVIDRMEHAILHGGRVINAVFRGFAKTTITENTALWASFYGYRRYVVVMSAVYPQAQEILDSILREITTNELLLEDFPEICVPYLALEGKSQRCKSQTYQGEPTHIGMSGGTLILPTIQLPDGRQAVGSSAIIRASGLNPPRRGMKFKRPDGQNARPDFAILDDFQDDQSADKPERVTKLLKRLYKAVLNSAGHGEEMSCVINATPIEPDDAVEQLFDHDRHPSFVGERIPMVIAWPKSHETHWQTYRTLRHDFDPGDHDAKAAAHARGNAYYAAHRCPMDDGAILTWPHIPLRPGEKSAIQHAYNMYFDSGPSTFATECQMEAAANLPDAVEPLTAIDVARRLSGFKRRQVPPHATCLTAGVDVHDDVLYWVLCAWTQRCEGFVLDYGTFPEQPSRYFTKRQAKYTLRSAHPGRSAEQGVLLGLQEVFQLLGPRLVGLPSKLLVDIGHRPNQVEQAIRTSQYAGVLQASRGDGIKADQTQIKDYERRRGWTLGNDWYIPPKAPGRSLRWLWFDAYTWKTWLWARWHVGLTQDGSLALYGSQGTDHRLFAEHVVSERPAEKEGRKGLRKIIWANTQRLDNHWLDCLVQAAVAADTLGCSLSGDGATPKGQRRKKLMEAARERGCLVE